MGFSFDPLRFWFFDTLELDFNFLNHRLIHCKRLQVTDLEFLSNGGQGQICKLYLRFLGGIEQRCSFCPLPELGFMIPIDDRIMSP